MQQTVVYLRPLMLHIIATQRESILP